MRISNVYIEIPNYDFSLTENDIFIGRKQSKQNLKRRINPTTKTSSYKGAYLIAGYRGMGKSTMVNRVVEEVKKEQEQKSKFKIYVINVYLSQENLSYFDVLKQLYIQFATEVEQDRPKNFYSNIISYIIYLFSILATIWGFFFLLKSSFNDDITKYLPTVSLNLVFLLIFVLSFISILKLSLSLYKLVSYLLSKLLLHEDKNLLFERMDQINYRLYSTLEISSKFENASPFHGFGAGSSILNQVLSLFDNNRSPKKQQFDPITSKELEHKFKVIIEEYSKLFNKNKILFIIDELDKLEPELFFINNNNERVKSKVETRKVSVAKLLANMKSFIHTSNAKYIFIGGAEMYDASLADIADREAFYSSIFHEVIYVNSFFKDYESSRSGLTQMVESYLTRVLLYNNTHTIKEYTLDAYYPVLNNSKLDDAIKIEVLYLLLRFVIYLTYRSNGSPKKLKELIEYYLINETDYDLDESIYLKTTPHCKLSPKARIVYRHIKKPAKVTGVFLKIDYKKQYKVGLLYSLYYPHIINNDRHLKLYNDRNLYVSAYLMDHILKFHRSAFSSRVLELVPDIILDNQGPNIREILDELISYLLKKHIRATTNAMFQYKFRSRTTMELIYISKISDESAAAYNFTYDESYNLKIFFKNKLREKISLYTSSNNTSNKDRYIHTLGYLNSTIADLHYYDEEFDSAIRYYADTIQPFRDLILQKSRLGKHQRILYTRNRLLLGLCLEKTRRFDSAYSVVKSLIVDLSSWKFSSIYDEGKEKSNDGYKEKNTLEWEDPFKRMQLFLRPFIHILSIIEKDRSDGITASNLRRNIYDYSNFMQLIPLFPEVLFDNELSFRDFYREGIDGDHKRIHTLLADYYQNVGSILFFKNRNFKSLLEKGLKELLKSYLKINNIPANLQYLRKYNNAEHQKYFFPSMISTFYYLIAVEHLITPYIENLVSIFPNDDKISVNNYFYVLDLLAYSSTAFQVLNGKQLAAIGLILSKLSDSILSCLGSNIGINISKNAINKLFEKEGYISWGIINNSASKLDFDNVFSLNCVFYLNILAYHFFLHSGSYTDAAFCMKKGLYILKTHYTILYVTNNKVIISDINDFAKILMGKFNEAIRFGRLDSIDEEKEKLNKIIKKYGIPSNEIVNSLCKSNDIEEVEMLYNFIKLNIHIKFNDESEIKRMKTNLENEIITINSIFTRIQKLRFYSSFMYRYLSYLLDKKQLKSIKSEIYDIIKKVELCITHLTNILKTHGYTYIMSYSYAGSLYQNILSWKKLVDKINIALKLSVDKSLCFDLGSDEKNIQSIAMEFYYKTIRLHSGGPEYKKMINDMYVLEDDQNDSLIHFCASLERSLINTGVIEQKIEQLK